MKELLVTCANPAALDKTLNQLGGVVGQNPDGSYRREPTPQDCYTVRHASGSDAGLGFLKFCIQNQGYATIVGEREIT